MTTEALTRRMLLLGGTALHGACRTRPNNIKKVLFEVLSRHYETVFLADGSLLAGAGVFGGLPRVSTARLQMPFLYLIAGFLDRESVKSQRFLAAESIEIAAVGARDFRPPMGLGAVLYDFCYVLKLSASHSVNIDHHNLGNRVVTAAHYQIWSSILRVGESPTPVTLYVGQPAARYIVVSSKLNDLQVIARQITSARPDASGTMSGTPEAFHYPIFGQRRYSHEASAISRQASGADNVTLAAKTLSVFGNPALRHLSIQYVTTDTVESPGERLRAERSLPSLKQIKPGVWQASVALAPDEHSQEQLFTIISMFGFGIYL